MATVLEPPPVPHCGLGKIKKSIDIRLGRVLPDHHFLLSKETFTIIKHAATLLANMNAYSQPDHGKTCFNHPITNYHYGLPSRITSVLKKYIWKTPNFSDLFE